MAKSIVDHGHLVIRTKETLTQEDVIRDMSTGKTRYYAASRSPLFGNDGEVIGVVGISVETTEKKEAERLQKEAEHLQKEAEKLAHENEIKMQRLIIEEKEKLIILAHTVAHDISSPLSALNMMMHVCDELKESKRSVIKRAIESILDIANNLLSTYRNEEQRVTSDIEQRQPVLISDLIIQLLSEKKVQYSNYAVRFETDIANNAQFAFAHLQASQFRRSMSNLMNNAVDALDNKSNGLITIKLTADAKYLTVVIQDNGKGMSSAMIEKMQNGQSFSEGKEQGHGLGLQQVRTTLDSNQGKMVVHSVPDEGTTIQLTFPRADAATWIAQTIHLAPNSIVVILDDDESIHGAWDTRFALYLKIYPTLSVHHFKHGQEALDFFNGLDQQDKDRTVFLSDYELLRQDKNGLEVIEESGIKNATLVTSYYSNATVRDRAILLAVKILPKQMASVVPIDVARAAAH
jgi:signal transduction histidine kinase